MRITTVIGQKWRNRWRQFAGAALTVALLSAVAVVGIALFGSEVLAAWKTPENAEQVLSSGGAFEGLLNFEAPAETVARFSAKTEQAQRSKGRTDTNPLLVANWKFTQNVFVDAFTQSLELYQEAVFLEGFVRFIQANPNVSPFNKAVFGSFEIAWVNLARSLQAIDNGLLQAFGLPTPPPIPPVSPSM